MDDQSSQLQYQPAGIVARRKRINHILSLIVVVLISVLVFRLGPIGLRQAKLLYWQPKCLNYSPSGSLVVFSRTAGMSPTYGYQPDWNEYCLLCGDSPSFASPLFLHGRQSRGGEERLVMVFPGYDGSSYLLQAAVYKPATLFSSTHFLRGSSLANAVSAQVLTIYAGQADEKDTSHFTIVADIDGQRTTFDGWLHDDDSVAIEKRESSPIPPPTSSPATFP